MTIKTFSDTKNHINNEKDQHIISELWLVFFSFKDWIKNWNIQVKIINAYIDKLFWLQ